MVIAPFFMGGRPMLHLHFLSRIIPTCFATAVMVAVMGCATPPPTGSKEAQFASGRAMTEKLTEAQLQDSLLRFANRYSTMVNEGIKILEASADPRIRDQALFRRLIYNSSALDISLGPSPQANLLDMVVFVELCRRTWNEYWVPKVFKDQGGAMTRLFDEASAEIWDIAGIALNDEQEAQLRALIRLWVEQHPDRISVENMRISEFSKESGARAQQMRDAAGGLLASVQGATAVGDRALLFSERALFYAQRAPFLWRLQAQAATRDVMTEALSTLASTSSILTHEPRIHRLLKDMQDTLQSVSRILSQSSEHPDVLTLASGTLIHLADTLREWNDVVSNPRHKEGVAQLAGIAESVDARVDRILVKAFGWGAALILLFGCVSLMSRLSYWMLVRRWGRKRRIRSVSQQRDRAA